MECFATINVKSRSLLLQRTLSKAFIAIFWAFQISLKSVWDRVFFVTPGNGNRGVQSVFEVYGYVKLDLVNVTYFRFFIPYLSLTDTFN